MNKQETMTLLRYSIIGGLLGVLLIPFVVVDGFYFPFITGKNLLFRAIIEVITVLWLVLITFDTSYRPKRSWIIWTVVAFTAFIGISDILAVNPVKSFLSNFERMEGWFTLVHIALYVVVAGSVMRLEKYWKTFLHFTLAVSGIVSLHAIIEHIDAVRKLEPGTRVDANFGNPTYLAIYLLFQIFFVLWLFGRDYFAARANKEKWPILGYYYVPLVILQLFALYYTATRGTMLGLLGGLFVTGVLLAIFERTNKGLRVAALGIVGAVIAVTLVFFAVKNTDFVRQSTVLGRFASISLSDATTLSRFTLWNMAYQGFKERPIFGWGQESFNYVFNKYYNPVIYNQEQWFDRSHNVVVDWVMAGGIVGLLSYFSLFAALVWLLWARSGLAIWEKSLITGLLAGYFFQNLFVFDNLTSYIFFGALLAYVHARSVSDGSFESSGTSKAQQRRDVRVQGGSQGLSEPWQYAVIITAILVGSISMYYVVIKPTVASATLIRALAQPDPKVVITPQQVQDFYMNKLDLFKDVIGSNTVGKYEAREQLFRISSEVIRQFGASTSTIAQSITTEYYQYTAAQAQMQVQETPQDARLYLLAGTFFQEIGQSTQAIQFLTKAHELSPNKQPITMALGSAYWSANDSKTAVSLFKESYEVYPANDEARKLYALVSLYVGDMATVNKLMGPGPVMDDRFLQGYRAGKHYDLMIAYLQKNLELKGNSFEAQVQLGIGYWMINDRQKALTTLTAALTQTQDASLRAQVQSLIDQIKQGKAPKF